MQRLKRPILAALCVGGGSILGIIYERGGSWQFGFHSYLGQVLHARIDGYDETDSNYDNRRDLLIRRRSEIMKFGYPSLDNIKYKDNYVLSYNRRLRQANWVCEECMGWFDCNSCKNLHYIVTDNWDEHLNKEVIEKQEADRSKCEFTADHEVHHFFRATNEDFRKTGYDRGHLAASMNHKFTQAVNCQTFFLSNVSPQIGSGFNRSAWKDLEKYVHNLAMYYQNVYVLTGPLFLPKLEYNGQKYVRYEVIGKNNVAVPTHFFKVIVTELYRNRYEIQAYILPNKPISEETKLQFFQVPIEEIEKASGLLIFEKLPWSVVRVVRPMV